MKKILSAFVAVAFLASPAFADDKAAPAPAKAQKAEKSQKKSKDAKKAPEDHSGHGHDSKPAAPAPSKEAR